MSISKSDLKRYRLLHRAKGRQEVGLFLVEGAELISEALKEGWPISEAKLTREFFSVTKGRNLQNKLELAGVPWKYCTVEELSRLSDAVTPQGAIALARMPEDDSSNSRVESSAVALICEMISDPGNLGTLIRTADWFGVESVIIGKGSADPFSPKVVRSTAGSLFHVKIHTSQNLKEFIRQEIGRGRILYAADARGDLQPSDLPRTGQRGLVVGHETRGLSQEIATMCVGIVGIPGDGRAESLNLSVSAGILLYALTLRK